MNYTRFYIFLWVRASYLEIYNEEIRDLLGKDPKNKCELKEHVENGIYVKVHLSPLTFKILNRGGD